jgi:hypothetical protein
MLTAQFLMLNATHLQIPRIAEDGTKTYVDIGPGKFGLPALVPLVVEFAEQVHRLLYGSLAEQVWACAEHIP